MKLKVIKITPSTNNLIGDITFYDDKACLYSSLYNTIFGEKKKNMSINSQQTSIVKITNPENNRSIYRVFTGFGLKKNEIGLTGTSCALLHIADDSEIIVSKGCYLLYYWYHPFHATRITFKVGLLSILLSTLYFLFSIFI